ncbi:LutB/LldF family L-lactate oxidation iron-sulfur protein [Rurimicrobium arvi]|uniref:LutB/LldF family L-lactate oxidation iron-sulfur protein n=1 Tax=Rurimicrobium arvi TaxID=2049916 RepID=A0ABP8MIK8_9BACT
MNQLQHTFLEKSDAKVFDAEHKRKISWNIRKYNDAVLRGKEQFAALEWSRKKAKNIKWRAIEELDRNLEQFEKRFTANGGKLLWAEDAKEALEHILAICKAHKASSIVKSKSMVTEEIHLNAFLEENGIESVETDLGEYIQQLDGEPPYHIVTPAMHKSKEDVAKLFHEKLGTPAGLSPAELTLVARENLRQKYQSAQIGITGANFWIADAGAVSVTENEGNGRLSTALPKVHIAVVGIEKVLPRLNDLELFLPLLATYGTGQRLTSYNTVFFGPRNGEELDGPDEMYVIMLDNGRTNLLATPEVRESMYCIRCGSCLNACPVYKNIGGHAYGTTYSGPIGAVITPHMKGMESYKHLSYASSLCGNCTEVCPLKINIHNMLLSNRQIAARDHMNGFQEQFAWKMWRRGMLSPRLLQMAGSGIKNQVFHAVFRHSWADHREELHFPKQTFRELFTKRKSGKE